MYFTDYHTHSLCSLDASFPLVDLARQGIAVGLSELCLTDHWDLLTEDGAPNFSYDWGPVLAQLAAARDALGDQIQLRLGLELGSGNVAPAAAREALKLPELDFVIGSLHNKSLGSGGIDFYSLPYASAADCHAMLDDYFSSMEALVPLDCYDVLGHILYPLRYFPPKFRITLAPYYGRIDAILKAAIAGGKGIEVNTYCGRTLSDWLPLLTHYRALGGEIVTTGSDAHTVKGIGAGIPEACTLLRQAGFRYYAIFRGRKPQFLNL